jgi:dTMP kinase
VSPKLRRGALVTLEGGEGSGKSSQAEALAALMREQGYGVVVTREPGGTVLGEIVKGIFQQDVAMPAESELFLFEAARAQHVQEVIRPALDRGDVLICDRYTDSTLAYQGYGRGLSLDHIRAVNHIATRGLPPHFTILLDVPPETGLARKDRERLGDSIGRAPLEFHQRVRAGFLELAQREPKRIVVVDASLPPEQVTKAAWQHLQGFLDHILEGKAGRPRRNVRGRSSAGRRTSLWATTQTRNCRNGLPVLLFWYYNASDVKTNHYTLSSPFLNFHPRPRWQAAAAALPCHRSALLADRCARCYDGPNQAAKPPTDSPARPRRCHLRPYPSASPPPAPTWAPASTASA